jgi:glucose-1-phosphate thymidylyltransferase
MRTMIALILAGGYATRLHPLTLNQPKHLLAIQGVPMLTRLMNQLKPLLDSCTHTYLVTNDRFAHQFQIWADTYCQKHPECPITVVNDKTTTNENRLGSVGDIAYVCDTYNIKDDLCIIGADCITDFDFAQLHKLFIQTNKPCIGIYDCKDLAVAKECGVVSIHADSTIATFVEKPQQPASTLIATLFYIIPAQFSSVYRTLVKQQLHDKAGNIIISLLKQTPVYTQTHTGLWIDIGTPQTYELAQKLFEGDGKY